MKTDFEAIEKTYLLLHKHKSLDELSSALKKSKRTVLRYIRHLQKNGVTIFRTAGRESKTKYFIEVK